MNTQKRNYATKKKGKTEVYPFRTVEDMNGMMNWFKEKEQWDNYLIFMCGLLLGRRIGDTLGMKWSDIFYENGRIKNEITTIEEQKTGKFTTLYVSPMFVDTLNFYLEKTNRDPMNEFDGFIFNTSGKIAWLKRSNDDIYKQESPYETLLKWSEKLSKDLSDKRMQKILNDFSNQSEYSLFGEYLYYDIEYKDIIKSQSETFRRNFEKAAKDVGIQYNVSTHSCRKTFGYWSKKIHPNDCDSLEILCQIFNHSDIKTTMNYIGLTSERKMQYFNDMGDFIDNVAKGTADVIKYNSPVITLRTSDIRIILKESIKNTDEDDIDKMNRLMDMIESMRVKEEK